VNLGTIRNHVQHELLRDRPSQELRGAIAVARQALGYIAVPEPDVRPALINGALGSVSFLEGRPVSIAAVTVRNGKIIELDFLRDPARLGELDLAILRA